MTGKDQPSPLGDHEQPGPESVDSAAAELPDAGATDARNDTPEERDKSAFEDTLSFHAWTGECAVCEDTQANGDMGVPAPPEAIQSAAQGENAEQELALSFEEAPAEQKKEEKTAREDTGGSEGKAMSLMEHLSELRSRLVRILIMVMLGFFACYAVSDTLFGEMVKPLTASMPQGSKLIFTAIPEAFFVYLKVGFVASLFLTSPYIFYQIWAFVAPGLYEEERRNIVPLAFFSAFFFLSGAAFCYFVVFPIVFQFFMSFATDTILPMPSLDEYLGFALKLLIAFGLIFEMPLFAFFLARIGVLTATHLRRWRKYAILASVIVGALLTPPDVPSQLIMASAILVLYEASIWIMVITQKRPKKQDAASDNNAENENKPVQEAS